MEKYGQIFVSQTSGPPPTTEEARLKEISRLIDTWKDKKEGKKEEERK